MATGEPGQLARALADLGASSCDQRVFADVLRQLGPVLARTGAEVQVARALAMMCQSAETGGAIVAPQSGALGGVSFGATRDVPAENAALAWNTSLFGLAVAEVLPRLDASRTLSLLDGPDFVVSDVRGAEAVVSFFKALCGKAFYERVDLKALTRPWTNVRGQLGLLLHMLMLPPEVLNLSHFSGARCVLTAEDCAGLPASARSIAAALVLQTWNCADVLEFTASVIDTDAFEDAKPIFELASRQCPELLCIALAAMDPSWDSINKEILVKLACGFLLGQPSSSVVLPRLWAQNAGVLLFCMVEMHRRDPTCLSRLLDVALELRALPAIVDTKPYAFALDMACLAARRQNLNMDKYLSDALRDKGEPFLRAAVEFLAERVAAQVTRTRAAAPALPVAQETLQALVRALTPYFGAMPVDAAEAFREALRALNAPGEGASQSQALGADMGDVPTAMPEMTFAADIEEEVNAFFDRIFAREVAVEDVVDVLRRLKGSASARDQQVFACFLHNIFDEFRFFGKYPDNELGLTAVLFGSLVQHHLVEYMPLGLALKCVLEALKKGAGTKLFRFGLVALAHFAPRLPEWPQFCTHLAALPALQGAHAALYAYVHSCAAGSPCAPPPASAVEPLVAGSSSVVAVRPAAAAPSVTSAPAANGASGTSAGDASNPLLAVSDAQPPADAVRDRILFLVNNLTHANAELKAADLHRVLEAAHHAWLAHYLVARRAAIEPNNHALYIALLDALDVAPLHSRVLAQTYAGIELLLRSPSIAGSSSERSLLKNLGAFLGAQTLARDRPILHRDLRLTELLLDAHRADRLIVVLPFVCKVLEQAARSRAFVPENPWLMAVLRLLSELYAFADLRLNLKFEVEVLCKALSVDLHALEPSDVVKARGRSGASAPAAIGAQTNAQAAQSGAQNTVPGAECALHSLVSLAAYRVGSARYATVLRALLAVAVEYAVRDIALAVAQRCFAIAAGTTRALVGKDHADASPSSAGAAMRKAAAAMAPALSSALASVTAREGLRAAVVSNMRAFCQWARVAHVLPDAAAEALADENMELACAYVERLAYERAASHADAAAPADLDASPYAVPGAPRAQPDALAAVYAEYVQRFRPAHLSALPAIPLDPVAQDELERFAAALAAMPAAEASGSAAADGLPSAPPMSPGVPAADALPHAADAFFDTATARATELFSALERAAASADAASVAALPPTHEVRALMKQVVLLASSSPVHRDELCLAMAQRVLQALFRTTTPLLVDVLVLLLIKIFEFSSRAAKEVTAWVVHSADERKHNVAATAALFASGLIYVLDYDGQLARQIDAAPEGSERAARLADFAVALIRRCVLEGSPSVAAPYDFVFTLEELGKTASATPAAAALLRDVAALVRAPQDDATALRDRVAFCFTDWFRLCQYPSVSDKLVASFVAQLFARRMLADDDAARTFFQICTELAVELYVRQRRAPAALAHRSIDAYARLVGQILRFHPGTAAAADGTEPATRVEPLRIATTVHSVAGMILIQGLEQGLSYLQRPFARLFSALAAEMLPALAATRPTDVAPFVENLAAFYGVLSPSTLSAFAFGWLELVTGRDFLPHMLVPGRAFSELIAASGSSAAAQMCESAVSPAVESQRHAALLATLLELLSFAFHALQRHDASDCARAMYRGVLRVLLVILHDCPAFLVAHGRQILNALPYSAVQLRNTVLAAAPTDAGPLPDPLVATVRTLAASREEDAVTRREEAAALLAPGLRATCDAALAALARTAGTHSAPGTLGRPILGALSAVLLAGIPAMQPAVSPLHQLPADTAAQISAAVAYIGLSELAAMPNGSDVRGLLRANSVLVDAVRTAFVSSDDATAAGLSVAHHALLRYLLVSAMADQLTYPCGTTSLFYCATLCVFEDAPQGHPLHSTPGAMLHTREVVTRVLLERLIVHRPHPWGVMVAFIELVKNSQFRFWDLPFTRATPDIERVFEAISRSCLGAAPPGASAAAIARV